MFHVPNEGKRSAYSGKKAKAEDIITSYKLEIFAEDNDIDIEEGDVDVAAERYVFEGEYDCDLSYWVNIKNLLS